METKGPDTASLVRAQYEQLPYPPRDPADEKHRLIPTVGDDLAELNHYCFKGKQTFRDHFRCLVAGGGTGDAVIYLAEQLRETNAEIVYLDMTEAPRRVAEARAEARGLRNIHWVTASLLDTPKLGLGKFHFINSSGVLHHLPEPKEGLQSLTSALHDSGAMYLMLYARYGRRGVYDIQSVLRSIAPDTLPATERIAVARSLLEQLPPGNYFQRTRDVWEPEIAAGGYGDAGLHDLLLHSQDRAYDIDALFEFLDAAGLALIDFTGRQKRSYDLDTLVKNPSVRARFEPLSRQQRFATAERLAGDIIKHSFYTARNEDRTAKIDDYLHNPTLAIVLAAELKGLHEQLSQAIIPGQTFSFTYTLGTKQEVFAIPGNAINKRLYKYFDGKTPIATMIELVRREARAVDAQAVNTELLRAFELLHPMGWAYLGER